MSEENPDSRAVILVEFSALRSEILQRMATRWNMFALQLTAAGVIFSFALANASHTGFLLILPITTYALTGRYVANRLGAQNIARYIREVLDPKVNGQLHWETWCEKLQPRARALTLLNPNFLAFPGVAVIALVWVAPYVWEGPDTSAGKRAVIVIIWFLGVAVTGLSFQLIWHLASYHLRWKDRQKIYQNTIPEKQSLEPPGEAARPKAVGAGYAEPSTVVESH
jgi:hypothetical protein